jgi:hypothetical protein
LLINTLDTNIKLHTHLKSKSSKGIKSILKDPSKLNRTKSSDKKKVKHLHHHSTNKMALLQAQLKNSQYKSYTYANYKEKFGEEYTNLGGLGNLINFIINRPKFRIS